MNFGKVAAVTALCLALSGAVEAGSRGAGGLSNDTGGRYSLQGFAASQVNKLGPMPRITTNFIHGQAEIDARAKYGDKYVDKNNRKARKERQARKRWKAKYQTYYERNMRGAPRNQLGGVGGTTSINNRNAVQCSTSSCR